MSDNIFLTTSLELTKVEVKGLQIGMHVSELDRPWVETTFIFQDFELKTTVDIEEVQRQCTYVFIDIEKTRKNKTKTPSIISRNTAYSKGWLADRKVPKKKCNYSAY